MRSWMIIEHERKAYSILPKLPGLVRKKYEVWKKIVMQKGPEGLRNYPGWHDEALKGKRKGQRSSRLSKKYRVIYEVDRQEVIVYVIELTPHDY